MSKAVGTRGSFTSQAGHRRLRKYQIKTWVAGEQVFWGARVPYGSWNRFDTWAEASAWLTERHRARATNARRRESRSR